MNLVKWFRKNNTKVMAVVVIVLMVGFVGGTALTQLLRGSGGASKAIAYYGPKKHKISYNDRSTAQSELKILQALGAPQILQYQDLRGVLLSELLFTQDRGSAELMTGLRQHIQRNRYRVSDKQLKEIYNRTVPSDIYWILLRDEAEAAGFHVRPEEVGQMLSRILPQLYNGGTYAQVMQAFVKQYGLPEKDILGTFGKLWAVLQYAEAVCSTENVTNSEIRHTAGYERQMYTAECVQLEASSFADEDMMPSEGEITTQFNKFKAFLAGQVSDTNPYAFGYKLPDRVQIEYIALDLTEVAATVNPPTPEETETYYQQNRERMFTEQVPSDPNDPNSPTVEKVQSYADVVGTITDQLTREKIISKAEQILLDARSQADAGLEATAADDDRTKLTLAQLKEEAGDYDEIAASLAQKNGVALFSGRSGLLSAADIQADEKLSRLFLTSYGSNPIRLSQLLFSVEELGDNAVTLMFVPKAELYQSIGPIQDPMVAQAPELTDQIMAIVRIVAVEPTAEPENVDVKYSTKTISLDDSDDDDDSVYSVKEQVVEDLRMLAAWDTAKAKAQELIELAGQEDWDKAVNQFNESYRELTQADPNDPNEFALRTLAGLQHIPSEQMEFIAMQAANSPGAGTYVRELVKEQLLVERLGELIPDQSDELGKVPMVVEFKPDQSFYCLKSLSIRRLNAQQFQSIRPTLLNRKAQIDAQSLAAIHFNPSNIVKRTKFEIIERQADDAEIKDANEPAQKDAA